MGDIRGEPTRLNYARPDSAPTEAHRRSLIKWGRATACAGGGVMVLAVAVVLWADGRLDDEPFGTVAMMCGGLLVLGAASCVAGIALCSAAASRPE